MLSIPLWPKKKIRDGSFFSRQLWSLRVWLTGRGAGECFYGPLPREEALWISSDRDDGMWAKIKAQTNPWTKVEPSQNSMPNFLALKMYSRNYAAWIRDILGNNNESSNCFEWTINATWFKSSSPKVYLPKISKSKKFFVRPCHALDPPSDCSHLGSPEIILKQQINSVTDISWLEEKIDDHF